MNKDYAMRRAEEGYSLTKSEDKVLGHSRNLSNTVNSSNAYVRMSNQHKISNPFVVARPKSNLILKNLRKSADVSHHAAKIVNFDSNWTRFCRGKLSVKATLTCNSCCYVLCNQAEVAPHTFQWYKGNNQERNQTGFLEDDNDGGLAGTFSRLKNRIDTEPRECNCIF